MSRSRRLRPPLAGAADLADRLLLPAVLGAAALGAVMPGPGRRLDHGGAILITLAVLVFCTGASLTSADLTAVRTAGGRLLLVLAVTTPVLPALAWLASRLAAGAVLRGGVLAAGLAPAEVASVALAGLAGGETVFAAAMLLASTLLTVLLAGPVLALLGARSAASMAGLLATLALAVALPLLAGGALRAATAPGGGDRPLPRLGSTASLLLLLWLVASQLRPAAAEVRAAAALLAFGAASAALGLLLARGTAPPRRAAIILPVAMRDFAVAAGIAASAFGPAAAAPLGIYGVMVLAGGAVYAHAARRR